jgi:trimeric autotransporter adhesin
MIMRHLTALALLALLVSAPVAVAGFLVNPFSYGVAGCTKVTYSTATTSTDEVVPAGCNSAVVKCWGAGGAGGSGLSGATNDGGPGGGGGFAQGTITVTPAETLKVAIGAGGLRHGTAGRPGGGGGYSGLFRTSISQANALIMAGAGGGGAGNDGVVGTEGEGGPGGASTGASGGAGLEGSTAATGGTQAAGGAAGTGGANGTAGSALQGGTGGAASGSTGGAPGGGPGGNDGRHAGGGGSGYYGGGGGGAFGGGGAGGSNFVTGTSTTSTQGSGVNPPNTGDAEYSSPAGVGGAGSDSGNLATAGSPGRCVIQYAA